MPLTHHTSARAWNLLRAAAMLAGIVGIFKGITRSLDPGAEFYWLFSYAHGFVKRGLIGTLVRPLVTRVPFEALKPMIAGAHVIACLFIVVIFQRLFSSAVTAESRSDSRMALALSFLCLMCSEMIPVLAHDAGSPDVYLIVLMLLGTWLILHGRYRIAVLVGVVARLIHEGFVFVWAPLGILVMWSAVSSGRQRVEKMAVAAAPFVTALAANPAHNGAAVGELMNEWAASDAVKSGHLAYTFGQTLQSSFEHMRTYEFAGHWSNVATAVSFFLVPNALLLWTAIFCYSRRWTLPRITLLVAIGAMLSPLIAIALAWDLSRFLVWSTAGAGVVLLAVGSPTLTCMEDARA